MATDTQEQQQHQERQQWEQQHPGQPYPGDFAQVQQPQQYELRSQGQFDSAFGEQVFSDSATREVAQAYWSQAEDTLRQARRISEIYAMSLMQQSLVSKISSVVVPHLTQQLRPQLTRDITQQVIAQLQANPSLIKPAVQQAMASR